MLCDWVLFMFVWLMALCAVSYEYIGTGVMQDSRVCDDMINCWHNAFELFSVLSC